jgi:2-phospho-L-lactate guanylyltransferase
LFRKANAIILAAVNFAVLPIKGLAQGKSRLAQFLSEEARRGLLRAMFLDVLESLIQAPSVYGVTVVTADPSLLDLARRQGVFTVDEGHPRGLNGAVSLGSEFCVQKGATSLLVLLADVPLVTSQEVENLFRQVRGGPEALLVPSKEGEGVNALLRVPPEVIPPCFVGGPSLQAYQAEAEKWGVSCRAVDVSGMAFDIDSIEDLEIFVAKPTNTRTYREMQRLGFLDVREEGRPPLVRLEPNRDRERM